MTRLAKNEIIFGKDIPAEEVIAGIDAVTAEEIRALAGEIFNPNEIGLAAIGRISENDLALSVLSG